MIFVDYREDSETKKSRGLWDDLKHTTLPIEKAKLTGGDFWFIGNGPDGEVSVGVEFKKIRDLLSSLRTKRLPGHQLVELQQYQFRYLLVEGAWRHDERGLVVLRSGYRDWKPAPGSFSAAELDKTLLGLTLRGGVYVWPTTTRRDTVRWIQSLYRGWTDKAWDAHTSHVGVHQPPTLRPLGGFRSALVAGFPHVGVKLSKLVKEHFGSMRRAAAAGPKAWEKIDGIGKDSAEDINRFLSGEED